MMDSPNNNPYTQVLSYVQKPGAVHKASQLPAYRGVCKCAGEAVGREKGRC